MGKVFEALQQANGASGAAVGPVSPPPGRFARALPPTAGAAEEVPYIEVGGAGRSFEASPSVLAAAPAPKVSEIPGVFVRADAAAALAFRPLHSAPSPWAPAKERFAAELVAFHDPEHPTSGQYRSLLTSLSAQLPATGPKLLLFTNAARGAGTTTVVLNLAVTMARKGELRVAVVDADFLRPAVAERLGLADAPGLCEVLAGNLSLQRAIQKTGQENLQALTAGKVVDSDVSLLGGEALRLLVGQLRKRFDWVLIDTPAWEEGTGMSRLASACDAVYLVLRETEMQTPLAEDLVQAIPQSGARLRGCILTQR